MCLCVLVCLCVYVLAVACQRVCPEGRPSEDCSRCVCEGHLLHGEVLSATGVPVPGARVALADHPQLVRARTNGEGLFKIPGACSGSKTLLLISKEKFAPVSIAPTSNNSSKTSWVRVVLKSSGERRRASSVQPTQDLQTTTPSLCGSLGQHNRGGCGLDEKHDLINRARQGWEMVETLKHINRNRICAVCQSVNHTLSLRPEPLISLLCFSKMFKLELPDVVTFYSNFLKHLCVSTVVDLSLSL